ncbi:hypothetical protein BT69DRAFT_1340258 [Atractiella rhizophila]|nr:hypothetical protein BT69DRAFT_1340258 [Atractiella rhizophila]
MAPLKTLSPPPAASPSNKRTADEAGLTTTSAGFTPNKKSHSPFNRVARFQQLNSRIGSESPLVHVNGLRPKVVNPEYRGLSRKGILKFNPRDWQNESTLCDFMERLFSVVLPESKPRYHKVDESLQSSGNATQRDSLKMDAMITSCKNDNVVAAYSCATCGIEVKTGDKSAAADGKVQLGRGAVYTLAAIPRTFFWGLLLDGPLDKKKFCWNFHSRGLRGESEMWNLRKDFDEFLSELSTLIAGDEKETGFLDIFDHDGTMVFSWDLSVPLSQDAYHDTSSSSSSSSSELPLVAELSSGGAPSRHPLPRFQT